MNCQICYNSADENCARCNQCEDELSEYIDGLVEGCAKLTAERDLARKQAKTAIDALASFKGKVEKERNRHGEVEASMWVAQEERDLARKQLEGARQERNDALSEWRKVKYALEEEHSRAEDFKRATRENRDEASLARKQAEAWKKAAEALNVVAHSSPINMGDSLAATQAIEAARKLEGES